ncbi:MAG TPA: pyruvate:ferredoxin (flavodoxin) oxidoreductase, partial [Chlamydiales bacterium]|nr:pyruvate:ferredoxin (flavodoxin) oxidoreductase [Chlamydiales bacterium]
GRSYHLFDYYGAEDAENVIVMMGSGAETAEETIHYLNGKGEKLGLVKVRLFRPFSVHHFIQALPKSVKKIAVLDRTKESGCLGEPLYLDVATAIKELKMDIEVVGGRYGLGSKDFTPAQVKTVFDNLKREEVKNHFTVGIVDDVTYLSLPMEEVMDTEDKDAVRCMFWGIGGDGTVGANKDAIKIIGDNTEKYVQGYFSYDSKKSGGVTISHLRFGKRPIHSTYLIQVADYVACHQSSYLQKGLPILDQIKPGGIFVLNSMWEKEELERNLPNKVKKQMAEKNIQFYHVNAIKIAKDIGLGSRINMIMQTVFFKLSNVLPIEKAIQLLKDAIVKSYGRKGEKIVQMNHAAVDEALNHLEKIEVPSSWKDLEETETFIDASRPDYVKNIADVMNRQEGDLLPVSAFLPGGILPSETTKYEKRSIATIVPEWIAENCIQCNQCSFVCPHAAIRPFLLTEEEAAKAPEGYVGIKPLGRGYEGLKYSIQVTPSDCTGCGNCAQVCPAMKKALHMTDIHEVEKRQKELWDYVTTLPNRKGKMSKYTLKGSQFEKPLLEFSGACAGCGETPYVKLVTQLFGNRMIIANATGCSSIWGGSAPSVPWALTDKGEGPAWANSLFEDNAEYGFGMAISVEYRRDELKKFVERAVSENAVSTELQELLKQWLEAYLIGDHSKELSYQIKPLLEKESSPLADEMKKRQDLFAKPSVWIMGGDGWAYDIGYGGLDHVLAMNRNVNILVLDTEVYSNTGGQASKSTPLGSVAKFAFDGKKTQKKDLGKIAMAYGNVYVATASMGYDKPGVVRALKEAEEYDGPSIVIVYATCIAHGIQKGGMGMSQDEQKKAVESGFWVNYRYDPRRSFEGKNPFQLDSKEPTIPLKEFLKGEVRFNSLLKTDPEEAALLQDELQNHYQKRFEEYKKMASEE